MTTRDEMDTVWLAQVARQTPKAFVLEDRDIERFARSTEDADVWLFGRPLLKEYLELRADVESELLGPAVLPPEEQRRNAALLAVFEPIEEEELI